MPNRKTAGNPPHKKQSVSFGPGIYEAAKEWAESLVPRTSVSAYISSLVEKDLRKRKVIVKDENPPEISSGAIAGGAADKSDRKR